MSNIRNYYKLSCVTAGAAWLGGAVCSLFNTIFTDTLSVAFFLIATVIAAIRIYWVSRTQMKGFDEMAETNLTKAKAHAITVLHMLVLLITILTLLKTVNLVSFQISGQTVALFALGVGELVTGLKFLKLERDGE